MRYSYRDSEWGYWGQSSKCGVQPYIYFVCLHSLWVPSPQSGCPGLKNKKPGKILIACFRHPPCNAKQFPFIPSLGEDTASYKVRLPNGFLNGRRLRMPFASNFTVFPNSMNSCKSLEQYPRWYDILFLEGNGIYFLLPCIPFSSFFRLIWNGILQSYNCWTIRRVLT